MAKEKNRGGRPKTTVKEKMEKIRFDLDRVKKLAEFGFTDVQLAELLGVTEKTIYNWKTECPELITALKEGKEINDARVVKSLLERAMGYEHEEDKIFLNSKTGEPVIVPTTKHYPPDPSSMIFWLKNRQPESWRDKTELQHTDSLLEKIRAMSPAQREARSKELDREWKKNKKSK